MVYKVFDKKIGSGKKKENVSKVLTQELYKLVINKFETRKVYEKFKYNI